MIFSILSVIRIILVTGIFMATPIILAASDARTVFSVDCEPDAPSIHVSPGGEYYMTIDGFARHPTCIRRVYDHFVYTRLPYHGGTMYKGFLTDSTVLLDNLDDCRSLTQNIHTGELKYLPPLHCQATVMDSVSLLHKRDGHGGWYRYDMRTRSSTYFCTGTRADEISTIPVSPYVVIHGIYDSLSDFNVYRKQDGSKTGRLDIHPVLPDTHAFAFSADGKNVFACTDARTVVMIDLETCREIRRFVFSEAASRQRIFSAPDGRTVYLLRDSSLQTIDLGSGELRTIRRLPGAPYVFNTIHWLPNTPGYVLTSSHMTVLYDDDNEPSRLLALSGCPVNSITDLDLRLLCNGTMLSLETGISLSIYIYGIDLTTTHTAGLRYSVYHMPLSDLRVGYLSPADGFELFSVCDDAPGTFPYKLPLGYLPLITDASMRYLIAADRNNHDMHVLDFMTGITRTVDIPGDAEVMNYHVKFGDHDSSVYLFLGTNGWRYGIYTNRLEQVRGTLRHPPRFADRIRLGSNGDNMMSTDGTRWLLGIKEKDLQATYVNGTSGESRVITIPPDRTDSAHTHIVSAGIFRNGSYIYIANDKGFVRLYRTLDLRQVDSIQLPGVDDFIEKLTYDTERQLLAYTSTYHELNVIEWPATTLSAPAEHEELPRACTPIMIRRGEDAVLPVDGVSTVRSVEVNDILGSTIPMTFTAFPGTSGSEVRIPFAHVVPGIYLVVIRTGVHALAARVLVTE